MTTKPGAPEGGTIKSAQDYFDEIDGLLAPLFEMMEWAEDEIAKSQRRHKAQSDLLWGTFKLLRPTDETADIMATEFVYRAHCRELLERVAKNGDTRPATDAEIAVACANSSAVAPLTETATGLYFRVWARAFPKHPVVTAETREHYEALHGSSIDDLEAWTRHKMRQDWRKLDVIAERKSA